LVNDCFWHDSDVPACPPDVRYRGKPDIQRPYAKSGKWDINEMPAASARVSRKIWPGDGVLQGRSPMTIHSDNKGHGLANNLPLQLGLVAVAALILIVLAALYVW